MPAGRICTLLSHASKDPKEALAYRNNMPTKNKKNAISL